ncbi:MAG: SRPBCC domain-containing protein [Acidimicrobiales bacterium]|nr:SRPBCC domain-containing protein [Hyphomonadaceae bacterium]RZV35890.1 MAG: SRPBCC domain-containing protein [Acidimicrobiales bacterium]
MSNIPCPDLSERPLAMTCTYTINAKPGDVFAAFTTGFDSWFAQPGTLSLVAEAGQPYFFYNRDEWGRHPHYGRILEIKRDRLVEMSWVTGNGEPVGTEGAETVLRIDLMPDGDKTRVKLTHSGFISEKSKQGHVDNWPLALDILDDVLTSA